jgi:2-hydroxychromene-2-carboxylate isomerase
MTAAFGNPAKLYFFFDFISHNAYLAWTEVPALARKHNLALEPVPVLFAALLKAYGQVGPAEVPAKSRWMLWNVLRKARLQGIPIAPPFSHPFNPLLMLRLCCCELPREQRFDLIDRLFRATWAQGRAVHQAEVLHEILLEAGLEADRLMEEAQSDTTKVALRRHFEGALAAGVFGVPSMLASGELFWGYDDLGFLEAHLSGTDPLGTDRAAYAPWLEIRPSAQRTR